MNDNRKLRRKNEAVARSKDRKAMRSYSESRSIYSENAIEKLNFLDQIQSNAPIDIHLSTLYSGVKIGSLDFLPLYKRCMEATSTSAPTWKVFRRAQRAQILAQYFMYALPIRGNMVECGVFRGFSALLTNLVADMCQENWTGEGFHLVDSFEGLSVPDDTDAIGYQDDIPGNRVPLISNQAGTFATPLETVKSNLKDFPRLSYHKGWIPSVFDNLPQTKWSFVHVDVDLYKPTFETLKYFYPRLAPGGVIINEDFSSPLFPGGGSGWSEFFSEIKQSFIILDSGQAIFIKDN